MNKHSGSDQKKNANLFGVINNAYNHVFTCENIKKQFYFELFYRNTVF